MTRGDGGGRLWTGPPTRAAPPCRTGSEAMPGRVARALDGAVALVAGRPVPPGSFDFSVFGFWFSFAAIVLVLPSFAVNVAASGAVMARLGDGAVPFGSLLLRQAMDWLALPIVLWLLVRSIGLAERYVAFVVVRNWTLVVLEAIAAVPAFLLNLGLLSDGVFILATFAACVFAYAVEYRVIRGVLARTTTEAIGFLVLDITLGLVITAAIGRVIEV